MNRAAVSQLPHAILVAVTYAALRWFCNGRREAARERLLAECKTALRCVHALQDDAERRSEAA